MRRFALIATFIATPLHAAPAFPDYEANEACGAIIATQLSNGVLKSSDAAGSLVMCRMGVDMFKPLALNLWLRADTDKQNMCLADGQRRANENSSPYVWYGHFVECLTPTDAGKRGRLSSK